MVGVGGADTEAATVVVVVNVDILRLVQTKTKTGGPCGGGERDREIVRRGGFRRSKIAWQEDLKLLWILDSRFSIFVCSARRRLQVVM